MSHPNKSHAPPTLLGQLILLILCATVTFFLYRFGQRGWEIALWAAVGMAIATLVVGVQFFSAIDLLNDRKKRQQRLESFAKNQRDAKLGDEQDALKSGLLNKNGIILGRIGKDLIRYAGEAAVMVAGRPGSWKGVAFVIRNLLDAPAPIPDKFQSYIALDISGELYSVCSRRLRELGYNVVVIASEAKRLSEELGIPIQSVHHNPASFLIPHGPNVIEDVETFVHLLHPGVEPGKQTGNNEHFDELARLILTTVILWMLTRYGEITLPGLRRCIMGSRDELLVLLESACETNYYGGALAESASSVLALMANSPEEFSGAITTATRSVSIYSGGGHVGELVSKGDFCWSQLKQEPTVVFIIVPPERLKSQAKFLSLVISSSAEALVRDRSNQRVIYMLDEVGNFYLPNLLPIIAQYRKYGIQVVLILQQLESQLARIYGKEAAREIQGNCDVVLALSTTELEDLRRLSSLAGEETIFTGTHTVQESPEGVPQISYTGSYQSQPLLPVDKIRRLDKSQAMLLYGNAPPFILDLSNYLHEPKLLQHADENPFYRKIKVTA